MSSASSTLSASATTTGPPAASSTTSGDGGTANKPLLFFVALGFGVVFTNLWIIVGVKYCFRYNHRSRQAMLNGDQIDMRNMQRPRRRREKKLMTMDEVNERFPLLKYKLWRAGREQEGLPTTGGITAPPSRAPSIREQQGLKRVSTEDPTLAAADADAPVQETPQLDPASETRDFAAESNARPHSAPADPAPVSEKKTPLRISVDEVRSPSVESSSQPEAENHTLPAPASPGAEEEDPISTAVPTEALNQPAGDSCAICIDSLDDDDDVRGLTCGHAFHAGCIDPWLTNRRACCPLCKADYFIPKTQAGADGNNPSGEATDLQPPAAAYQPIVNLGGTSFFVYRDARYGFPLFRRNPAATTQEQGQTEGQGQSQVSQQRRGPARVVHWVGTVPSRMPWSRRRQQQQTPASEAAVTPAQLEAGPAPS